MKTKFKVEFLSPDGVHVSDTQVFEVSPELLKEAYQLETVTQEDVVKEAQRHVRSYADMNGYDEWRFDV